MKIPNTTRAAYGIRFENPIYLQKGFLKRYFRKRFIKEQLNADKKLVDSEIFQMTCDVKDNDWGDFDEDDEGWLSYIDRIPTKHKFTN